MGTTEIPRIPDHKFVFEIPLSSQSVIGVRNGENIFVIAPIVDNINPIRIDAPIGHTLSKNYICGGFLQGSVAHEA